jgi:alkylhydroperoxidase/carboxymuconolactone decarboxylase family protein YurZ
VSEQDALDRRTYLLTVIGQFTCMKEESALADAIASSINAGVAAREILETILQCVVVAGDTVVAHALPVFQRLVADAGLLDELRSSKLPIGGRDAERSLETEIPDWDPADAADPRREHLMAEYGWLGLSTGLRQRPGHMWDMLEYLDSLDVNFARAWLGFSYHGMYSRSVLDDRTRVLCQAANCVAIGALTQFRAHVRGAMRHGVSAREMLAVIIQGSVHLGMPATFAALKVLTSVLEEDGKLGELGNPVLTEKLRKTIG